MATVRVNNTRFQLQSKHVNDGFCQLRHYSNEGAQDSTAHDVRWQIKAKKALHYKLPRITARHRGGLPSCIRAIDR